MSTVVNDYGAEAKVVKSVENYVERRHEDGEEHVLKPHRCGRDEQIHQDVD